MSISPSGDLEQSAGQGLDWLLLRKIVPRTGGCAWRARSMSTGVMSFTPKSSLGHLDVALDRLDTYGVRARSDWIARYKGIERASDARIDRAERRLLGHDYTICPKDTSAWPRCAPQSVR